MPLSTRVLTTALLLLATAFPVAAQETGDPASGLGLARTWCSDCHIVAPGQKRGTDAVPPFAAIAAMPSTTALSLRAFLTTPHGKMPDLKLSNPQIDDVVAYILTLRQR